MSQQAGFIDTDIQEREYPDPGWIEAREPAHMTPEGKDRRVVRVTQKTFDSIYADQGYEIVERKK